MGKNHEPCNNSSLQEDIFGESDKRHSLTSKDTGTLKDVVDYTNRRKIQKSSESHKISEERRKENEEEFEYIRLQLQEFSVASGLSKMSAVRRMNSRSTSNSSTSRHPEVEAFQRFLDEEGGHYGGWKEKDHLFFLNTRRKHPLKKTAEIVHENFPDISVEKILAHDTWYKEYLQLKSAKKKAIDEWKKCQKKSAKVEEEQITECNPQSETKAQLKRDPNLKEKIEVWKAHCFAAKLERQEQQKVEEAKRKKEEEERKRIQEEKRALVNQYREEKLSLELAMKMTKEAEELEAKREAAAKTAALLKFFRYEDRRFTERQKAKKQSQSKPEPRVRSAFEAKRDPNRLLQPTLGWIYHTKRSVEENQTNSTITPLDLRHVPKLKIPAWRRGLTSP